MTDHLRRIQDALSDRYAFVREVGRGGMALVYLAEDLKHRRRVALKVLKPELGMALGAERFLREIEIAARLTHPNILPLYDSGEVTVPGQPSLLYYVMPYVEGETLRARLERETQLPLEQAVDIAREVADALGYAHSQGLVHRDIKPENIMFQAGHAVVTDFGIARAVNQATEGSSQHLTETGLAIGTRAYMSPEQAIGLKDVDGRTDIYSLGCVLYEMLAGQVPLGPSTSGSVAEGPAAEIRESRAAVSRPLALVVGKALARVPAQRYATADVFKRALSAAEREVFPIRPVVRAAAAILLILALLGAAFAAIPPLRSRLFGSGSNTPASIKLAVLPFQNRSGDPARGVFTDALTEELITELGRVNPGRLGVIARGSVQRYRETDKSPDVIGAELGAQYLVEGSVLHEGSRVRIAARLIRVSDQTQLWGENYDRELSGIATVHTEVARAVVRELAVTLLPSEEARLAAVRPVDPRAYEAYLQGRFFLGSQPNAENLSAALRYLEKALQIAPDYAAAHAAVAEAWWLRGNFLLVPFGEAHARAKSAAEESLRLDDRLAEGHDILARVLFWYEWDWAGAEREYRRAIDLDPGKASPRLYYTTLLMTQGRFEDAEAQITRAQELDPLSPGPTGMRAYALGQRRRYGAAIAEATKALQMAEPDAEMMREVTWRAHHLSGNRREAVEALKSMYAGDREILAAAALADALPRYAEAMRTAADRLAARPNLGIFDFEHVAILYAFSGENAKALDWLEKGYATHHSMMSFIAVDPHWETLHGEPRFVALMQKLKLPQLPRDR